MSKGNFISKIFAIILVFVMIGSILGVLPSIGNSPPAEGAGPPQPAEASTVAGAGDGALGETISIVYDFSKPRIEQTWSIPPSRPDVSPPSATTERKPQLGNGYVSVVMEGLPQWSEAGLPVLPFRTARILLPYGTEMQDITVTYGNKVSVPGSYLVEPGQEPIPLSYEGPVNLTLPNSEVYDSSSPFPGNLWSDITVQSKTGYRILLVNLHPVEYIPKTGKLSYYESMTVTVTLGAASEDEYLPCRGLPQDGKTITGMVDNLGILNTYSASRISREEGSLLESGDYEYVIITSETLNATPGPYNFQALRDDKISRGITATIITTEWIYANYDGTRPDGGEDNQTRIRNFIIDAYSTWGTRYVLLGGDGDGGDVGGESGDDIIPHRGFASLDDDDIPADMYYACLEGTFDYNANGTYGEPNDGLGGGEVDLFAEVYVGRACVDSQTEVNNFVRKTLAYQNITLTDQNLRKVWMVGGELGFGGVADWGGNYKDEIKEGSTVYGYPTIGFENSPYAGSFDVSTLYDRDGSWSKSEIISIINGNAHLINHLGHSNVPYVMKMYNPDVDNLTNDELYFIGYSQGCYNGAFDDRDALPPNGFGDYLDYDCISEHLTTEAHGAVAFIANSRYGWGALGSTDGPSQHFDREFWDAVLGEDICAIGIANQDSKEDNAGRIGDPKDRWCYYELNLFGDPELRIKLEGVSHDSHEIDDGAGGNGNEYPEPGESITMPVTLRNTFVATDFLDVNATLSATTILTTVIFSEDFEGSWPGDWTVGDWNSSSGTDYWGQSSYRAHSGNYSAYCAEVSDIPGQEYDNGMYAYMYRDVDLSAYNSAILSYHYWLDSESGYDYLVVDYYDGSWQIANWYDGYSGGWVQDSSSIPATATSVRFVFWSNGSVTEEGAYIDDVVLTGYALAPDPYISITDNYEEYGGITAGGTATCSGYDFNIAPACPADHTVIFNLDIHASNGGPWTDSFDVTIQGAPLVPEISFSPSSFEESLPENTTGNYTLTISNDGDATLTYNISDRETTGKGSAVRDVEGLLLEPASMVLEVPLEGSPMRAEDTGELESGWQDIMAEDFEGIFPGDWELWVHPEAADAYWGKDSYNPHNGSYSAFCAKSGTAGVNPPADYPNDMEAWMVYGPFSLADATNATLDFYFWLDSEYEWDYLWCMASIDLSNWYGWWFTGDWEDWVPFSFDLTDLCGETQVWIAFIFDSDYMITDKGAFIDDIELRKYVGAANNPPNTPSNPSPANHTTNVSIDADLSWTGGDPDLGDTVTYDIYFGTSSTPPSVSNDQSGITYDPGTLAYNTKYYWKVVAEDNHGATTSGPLWDFTTQAPGNNPPYEPSSPSPSNHATNVSIDVDLSWSGGDPDVGDTVTYDIHFGTSSTPPLVSNDQSGITYDPGTLANNTKYYWKVVATDNHAASTAGPVWDFTTGEATEDCPWLHENPESGSVEPGSSDNITVTINTTGLAKGNYTAEIVITNNDPDENPTIVPVTLHVTTMPCNLTVSSTSGGNVTTPGEGVQGPYNYSEVVDLVATADNGYQFVNWTGDTVMIANVNAPSTNITMNGSYSITANFEEIPPVTYNVTVKIEPSTTYVGVNDSFTIDAVINNPSAQPVAMHQICLNFDPNYFTVDSVSLVDLPQDMGLPTINNTAGHVDYEPHMPPGQNTTNTHIVSARISCTAKSLVGTSTISWVYTSGPPPRYTKVVKGTTDYLESGNMSLMFNGTVEVVPGTTLEGHVDLQGLPATNITVRFFDPGTQNERMKKYTSTDSNGDFTIGNITPGTYDVGVKGSTSLSNLESGVNLTGGGTTYREFGVLLEGDASGDDYVDGSDFGPLSDAWLSYPGCPKGNWDASCDFSRDNYIDGSDFGPLSDNWLDWGDLYGV